MGVGGGACACVFVRLARALSARAGHRDSLLVELGALGFYKTPVQSRVVITRNSCYALFFGLEPCKRGSNNENHGRTRLRAATVRWWLRIQHAHKRCEQVTRFVSK